MGKVWILILFFQSLVVKKTRSVCDSTRSNDDSCLADTIPMKSTEKTNVYAILKIDSISPQNEDTLDVEMAIIIELFWKVDKNDMYDYVYQKYDRPSIDTDHLWVPDIEIIGTKAKMHFAHQHVEHEVLKVTENLNDHFKHLYGTNDDKPNQQQKEKDVKADIKISDDGHENGQHQLDRYEFLKYRVYLYV